MKTYQLMLSSVLIAAVVVLVPSLLEGRRVQRYLKINQNRIDSISDQISDLKEQLSTESSEPVTKADLVAFTELNNLNIQIAQLNIDGRIKVSDTSYLVVPFEAVSLVFLCYLLFNVGNINKQNKKQSSTSLSNK
ncbi:MAG: hypothetical protein P8016_13170 [Sedimentisphaerales bacterium]